MTRPALSRRELELSAWAIALAAGESMRNGALGRGIADAIGGRLFADSRLAHDCRADYALGYQLARFALLNRVRHCATIGDGKRRLYWQFRASPEGKAHGAQYRFPPQLNVESGKCK